MQVWDHQQLACLARLSGHTAPLTCVRWDAAPGVDDRAARLLLTSHDHYVSIWRRRRDTSGAGTGDDVPLFEVVHWLQGHTASVMCGEWCAAGSERVVTGSVDKELRVWDAAAGGCLMRLSGSGPCRRIAPHPSFADVITTAEGASGLRMWADADSLALDTSLDWVTAVVWRSDAAALLASTADGQVVLYADSATTLSLQEPLLSPPVRPPRTKKREDLD